MSTNVNMDMDLIKLGYRAIVHDETELGIKAYQNDTDDNFLYFKNAFKGYVLFKVTMFFAAKIDTGETEPKEFGSSEHKLVYIEKRFLKDCGDGVWFISEESHKYIFNNLSNAKPNQIRLIID